MNKKVVVVVGIVEKDDSVLVIKRNKPVGDLLRSFPGGKVENGESDIDAVKREVLEETGILCKPVQLVGIKSITDAINIDLSYWLCEYIDGETKIDHPNEISDVQRASKSSIEKLFTTPIYGPVKKILLPDKQI